MLRQAKKTTKVGEYIHLQWKVAVPQHVPQKGYFMKAADNKLLFILAVQPAAKQQEINNLCENEY